MLQASVITSPQAVGRAVVPPRRSAKVVVTEKRGGPGVNAFIQESALV